MNKPVTLVGKRITMTNIMLADLEYLRELRNSNKRYFITQNEITAEDQLKWYNRYLADDTDLTLVIRDETPLGMFGIYHIDYQKKTAEFGRLLLDPKTRGLGYGKEAVSLLIDYGFRNMGMSELYADIFTWNEPCLNVFRKLKFNMEPRLEMVRIWMHQKDWKQE